MRHNSFLAVEFQRHVAQHRAKIQEVLLEDVGAMTKTQHEVAEPDVRESLHDVPDKRPPAYRDHRLGQITTGAREPSAHTAAEDHHFHNREPPAAYCRPPPSSRDAPADASRSRTCQAAFDCSSRWKRSRIAIVDLATMTSLMTRSMSAPT